MSCASSSFRDARDALIAVAPMMSTWRPSFGPIRLQMLRFFGHDPNVTEIRGLVCEPEHEVAALEAVRRFLAAEYPKADWIELGALRQENARRLHASCPPAPAAPGAR